MRKFLVLVLSICCVFAFSQTAFAAATVDEYDPAQIILPFEKVWDDNGDAADLRPDTVTVKLYRYTGDSYTEADLFETATVKASEDWKYDFDVTGNAFYADSTALGGYRAYKFAVAEDPIENYSEVTSAHVDPYVELTIAGGTGSWDRVEPNNQLEHSIVTSTYPMSFVVMKHGYSSVVWSPDELSAFEQGILFNAIKTHEGFGGLDISNAVFVSGVGTSAYGMTIQADKIVFDAHPVWSFYAVGSYTRSTPDQYAASITNEVTTTSVSVSKEWNDGDNQDGIRPGSVTVQLLADGAAVSGKTVTLSDSAGWSATFDNLPVTQDGKTIVYTVEEVKSSVITGTNQPGEYKDEVSGDAANGFVITNTHTPETVDISVSKEWSDGVDQDAIRPDSVEVTLLADGVPVSGAEALVLSDANDWTASWNGMPKYAAGELIDYTVEESLTDVVTGTDGLGTYAFEISGDIANGFLVVNTHTPATTEVFVVKYWEDEDNAEGARPDTITVRLLADGTEIDSADITEADDWAATFTDLPVYKDGTTITYTVTEDAVTGYTPEVTGSVEDGFVITNTYTPAPEPTPTPDPDDPTPDPDNPAPTPTPAPDDAPSTGDPFALGLCLALMLLSAAAIGGRMACVRKR